MLHIVIVVLAVIELLYFYVFGDAPLQWEIVLAPGSVRWFNALSVYAVVVF